MGGRAEETTNAWDPTEESVAQRTAEARAKDIFRYHPEPPKGLKYALKRDRRKIHRHVYRGCDWVDLDAIEAEAAELLETDPAQAERFFGNNVVSGSDKAWDIDEYKQLAADRTIPAGALVTLGFDGSRRQDSTGLVATDVQTGHQQVVGVWERPADVLEDDFEITDGEVDEAVAFAFDEWDVWRLYGDPPYWESALDRWAGQYGDQRVIRWWTNRTKAMAYALKAFTGDMREDAMSHDGHEALVRHIGNAVKTNTRMRDPDTSGWLWVIRKESAKSPRKIDLAMAACLSWEARGDAIAAGATSEPVYETAQW
jgi:hypothetical protein